MKTRKHIIGLSAFLLLFTGVLCSCTNWLDEQPNDKQSEEQQFADRDGFHSAVNGIYNRMGGSSLYGKTLSYEFIDLLGQYYQVDMVSQENTYKYLRAACDWDYSNETIVSKLESTWQEAYATIMNINVILNNLETDIEERHVLSEREYKMLKGEMLAARAMIHLDMLRLFGPIYSKNPMGRGIPYNDITTPDILPILNAQEVLNDYILRDLVEAEGLLLASDPVLTDGPMAVYDEINNDNSMRYRQLRLNYYATVLLTARAYLWGGNNAQALAEARKLTDDPQVRSFFPAVDASNVGNSYDPDRMFTSECLFGYYNKNRGLIYDYTFGGKNTNKNLLIPRPNYVREKLFHGYGADGDDYRYRMQYESASTLVDGEVSSALTKFKAINEKTEISGGDEIDESGELAASKFYGTFCSLIKLSEAYYIAAEALGTTGSEVYNLPLAWDYLNAMREARGITGYSKANKEEVLQFLLNLEYVREFVGEGQKFFYFKRRNMGFNNEYNGRRAFQEWQGFPWGGGQWVDKADPATDEEKERRFVLPLPKNELDNR